MSCTEFSVNLALLASGNKRQISFGMMRGCQDANTPFYAMTFILRDQIDGEFQDRVKVDVTFGPTFNEKAEAMMKRGLTAAQIDFLQGPMTTRAKKLPPTGSTPVKDDKMKALGEELTGIK